MALATMMGGRSNPVQDRDEPNKWLVTAAVVCGTLRIGVTVSMMNLAIPLAGVSAATEVQAASLLSGYHNYFYLIALLIFGTMIPALLVHSASRPVQR